MVRGERDFVVYDAKSGEDLTHAVLTQIIVEQEGRGTSMLPVPFLRQLIRFYGDSMSAFVPSYLQMSMENLTRDQERYRTQFSHLFSGKAFPPIPFGTAAFDALQQQTRQNMAMFERALGMFTPFPVGTPGAGTPGAAGRRQSSRYGGQWRASTRQRFGAGQAAGRGPAKWRERRGTGRTQGATRGHAGQDREDGWRQGLTGLGSSAKSLAPLSWRHCLWRRALQYQTPAFHRVRGSIAPAP